MSKQSHRRLILWEKSARKMDGNKFASAGSMQISGETEDANWNCQGARQILEFLIDTLEWVPSNIGQITAVEESSGSSNFRIGNAYRVYQTLPSCHHGGQFTDNVHGSFQQLSISVRHENWRKCLQTCMTSILPDVLLSKDCTNLLC